MQSKLSQFIYSSGLVSLSGSLLIAENFKPLSLDKNDYLLRQGQISNTYFFLESGLLRSFATDVSGNDVTTAFYSSQQIVFEVSSYFNRKASKENIHALTDCTGSFISFEQLNTLFHTLPEFREFGRSMLVSGFAMLKSRMLGMITESAEERYDAFVKNNSEVLQHSPLKYIASYLGITDTSLSRIRKESLKKSV